MSCILLRCYFTLTLSFMYRAITNNLHALNFRDFLVAAHLLSSTSLHSAQLLALLNLRMCLLVLLLLSSFFLLTSISSSLFLPISSFPPLCPLLSLPTSFLPIWSPPLRPPFSTLSYFFPFYPILRFCFPLR